MTGDLGLLLELGECLDARPSVLRGHCALGLPPPDDGPEPASVRDFLAAALLKIRDKQGQLVALRPNRVQRAFSRRCRRRNLVLKARQLGVTTWVAARFFVHTITRPGTLSVQVAHDQHSAEELFRIVHRFLENLPERLRQGALETSRANVRQIVFPRLDSQYRVETAADPNAGRGLTIHNLHASEVARWPRDARETLATLRAAVPPQGEVVLESTPNGAAGCFYEEWQSAEERDYVRHFFPWWGEKSYEVEPPPAAAGPDEEERALMARHGLTLAQIAFRRQVQANFRSLAAQEFAEDPEGCFLASGECVFDLDAIARRLATCGAPVETRDNGRLQVWLPPARGGRGYILGVDSAGGGTLGDYACAQVIDRFSGMQCAELRGHFTPQELARRVVKLGREYHDALVAVERNNHGHAVLAHLVCSEPYENLYEQGGQPGWLTSAATRPAMIENLAAVLVSAAHLFSSARLLQECRTFVRHADGSSAAAAGAHDDCVLAMAIAHMVRTADAGRLSRSGTLALGSLPVR